MTNEIVGALLLATCHYFTQLKASYIESAHNFTQEYGIKHRLNYKDNFDSISFKEKING